MLVKEWNVEDAIAYTRKEALEEGREEGIEIGREKEKLENARSLKTAGVSPDIIAKALGLPLEEIAKL